MIPEVTLNQWCTGNRKIKTPDQSPLTKITPSVCSPLSTTVPQSDGAPGAHSLSQLTSPCLTSLLAFSVIISQIKYLHWNLSLRICFWKHSNLGTIYLGVKLLDCRVWLFWIKSQVCAYMYNMYIYMSVCIVKLISKAVRSLIDTEWHLSFKHLILLDFLLIFTHHMSGNWYLATSILSVLVSLSFPYGMSITYTCWINKMYPQYFLFLINYICLFIFTPEKSWRIHQFSNSLIWFSQIIKLLPLDLLFLLFKSFR